MTSGATVCDGPQSWEPVESPELWRLGLGRQGRGGSRIMQDAISHEAGPIISLWFGGLNENVTDDMLRARIEQVRVDKELPHKGELGTYTIRRMLMTAPGTAPGAWVDFTTAAYAQQAQTLLNGSTIGANPILVRYSRVGELTNSAPGAGRSLWMSRTAGGSPVAWSERPVQCNHATLQSSAASKAAAAAPMASAALAAAPSAASSAVPTPAPAPAPASFLQPSAAAAVPALPPDELCDAKRRRQEEPAAGDAKRRRKEGHGDISREEELRPARDAVGAGMVGGDRPDERLHVDGRDDEWPGSRGVGGGGDPSSVGGGGTDSTSLGAADAFDEAIASEAEALRRALDRAAVSTALAEIRHFLQHDPRLPAKTRNAVQFLDGLRGQMVQAQKEVSHPQYFDCPFVATDVRHYTFKEVRQKFGEQFQDKFWPIFQAFNCLLPVLAPEPERENAIGSFLGPN